QPGEAVSLDLLRQLLLHICRRRAWPRAVFERERMREADLPHQLQCLIEFLLCLAGEADDDVCGERDIRPGFTNPLYGTQVILCRMLAVHRGQDAIRARLERQV